MTFVYLDTETTGLDPTRHQVWEVAYAVEDGPVYSSFVSHNPAGADPVALELNGYLGRFRGEPLLGLEFEANLREELQGATLVGANPAFDAAFLRARWGVEPWHHRLLDVEAYGAGVLGYTKGKLPGLKDLSTSMWQLGYPIPVPDHTAATDVEVLRAVHRALVAEVNKR